MQVENVSYHSGCFYSAVLMLACWKVLLSINAAKQELRGQWSGIFIVYYWTDLPKISSAWIIALFHEHII